MEELIFLDTSFIISFCNSDDSKYEESQMVIKKTLIKYPKIKFCYSDYIFDEVITLMKSRNVPHSKIKETGEKILNSEVWKRIKFSENIFQKTWVNTKKYADKDWSFTDISSFVIMDEFKIKNYLSYNSHFEQNPNITAWTI